MARYRNCGFYAIANRQQFGRFRTLLEAEELGQEPRKEGQNSDYIFRLRVVHRIWGVFKRGRVFIQAATPEMECAIPCSSSNETSLDHGNVSHTMVLPSTFIKLV